MSSLISSDKAKMGALINLLGLVVKIGKYLPLIVCSLAMTNLAIVILSSLVWNDMISSIINSIFALSGFIFLAQLLQRRKDRKYRYKYIRRHALKPSENEVFSQGEHSKKPNTTSYSEA
jgi:hypothetical protein